MLILPATRGFLGAVALPISFSFPFTYAVKGATQVQASSPVANLPGTTTATVSGGLNAQVSADGSTWAASASIPVGGIVYVRQDAPNVFGSQNVCTVTIGTVSQNYTVAVGQPPSFSFTNAPISAPGSIVTSSSVVDNIVATTPVTVTGSTAQISNNGSTWGTSTTINPGGTIYVRLTVPNYNQTNTATVSIEGVSQTFSVTACTQPSFNFSSVNPGGYAANVVLPNSGTYMVSAPITNCNLAGSISVSGGGAQISNSSGGPWGTGGTANPGDTIYLRMNAPSTVAYGASVSCTVTFEGTSQTWTLSTPLQPSASVPNLSNLPQQTYVYSSGPIINCNYPSTCYINGDTSTCSMSAGGAYAASGVYTVPGATLTYSAQSPWAPGVQNFYHAWYASPGGGLPDVKLQDWMIWTA